MSFIEKIFETVNVSIKNSFTYVEATWAAIVVNILQISVFYFVWKAMYSGVDIMHGISRNQIVTYVILSRIIYMQVQWGVNIILKDSIVNGQVSIDILRPIDFQLYVYLIRIGDLLSTVLTIGLPSLVASVLMFRLSPPITLLNGLLFFISLVLAVTIAFFIEFFVGLLSFYTANGWGTQVFKDAVMSFFTGALIPITFFPGWLSKINDLLPFKDIVFTPISIYLGLTNSSQLFRVLVFQLLWVLILMIFTRLFWKIAIRKVIIQGG